MLALLSVSGSVFVQAFYTKSIDKVRHGQTRRTTGILSVYNNSNNNIVTVIIRMIKNNSNNNHNNN